MADTTWDKAVDIAITIQLKELGVPLPDGVEVREDCALLSAEEIYQKLKEEGNE